MSDEQAPIEETPDAVEGTASDEQTQAIIDWEKRYNDLRPEFDRTSQELAEARRKAELVEALGSEDQHTRNAALEALGFEPVDTEDEVEIDEDDDLYADPVARRRLERLEQRYEQEEAARQQAANEAAEQARIDQAMQIVTEKIESLGVDETAGEAIFALSLMLPHTPQGLPDIEAAHKKFTALENAMKQSWAGSKRGAHVSPVGTSGTQVPDLDDDKQRQAWMLEQLHARGES